MSSAGTRWLVNREFLQERDEGHVSTAPSAARRHARRASKKYDAPALFRGCKTQNATKEYGEVVPMEMTFASSKTR